MDPDSDHDSGFQVGRCPTPSSSRESSPAVKRLKRSFTPTSDDGDLVVPVAHSEDVETPTPGYVPLIRQAVGFSWTPSTNANVSTYQATTATPSVVSHFLPGQAPIPAPPAPPAPPPPAPSAPPAPPAPPAPSVPPAYSAPSTSLAPPAPPAPAPAPVPPPKAKPKATKSRAPKRKKGAQYSGQTGRFKLSDTTFPLSPVPGPSSITPPSARNSAGAARPPRTMMTASGYPFGHANGNTTSGSRNINGTINVTPDAPPVGVKRTKNSSKKRAYASVDESFGQSSTRPAFEQQPATCTFTPSQYSNTGGSSRERSERTLDPQRNCVPSGGASMEHTNGSITQGSPQNVSRPLRMVTLLIEDVRSGIKDSQLAEVKVPLRIADDPEDGFWADAIEICDALQGSPSRIDGPAKVYTMRGRFRQFFMRVDQFDQVEVQSAHIGVSKERTLDVFVEAPVAQGHMPRPPTLPPDVRPAHHSGSERETMSPTPSYYRPTFSLVTREEQMERIAKSNYIKADKRRLTPVSESGSYGHSQRARSPNPQHQWSRHDHDRYPSQRSLSPAVPGQMADTEEERNEAIANYIRSHIENHSGWMDYMQSKGKPQRVSEVLKRFTFVEDRVRELIGIKTPQHWDGAPDCYIERQHVWRVLRIDPVRGQECDDTMTLVGFYGPGGSRYEDSRVVDMINDTSPPKANTMDKFLRLLRSVDDHFTEDVLAPRFTQAPVAD